MRYIHSQESLNIPENGEPVLISPLSMMNSAMVALPDPLAAWQSGYHQCKNYRRSMLTIKQVKVRIKSRIVTVEGPRGKLVKDMSHLSVCFSHPAKNVISIELHHGARKNVATLRTVKTLINNLIIGVTKGFKYKMRYVYAHFPINVNIEKNPETDLYEVDIRNFIGEKIVRRVTMLPGVDVEASKNQKDELQLTGNSLENVSQSAADIQQICMVRNKDIRKFLDGLYVSERGNIEE